MKKYLQNAGYRFLDNSNDLNDKDFILISTTFEDGESKTFKNFVLDRTETYQMFLKVLDAELFSTKMEGILAGAISAGVNVSDGTSISAEKVENGFDINLTFTIKG